MMHFRGFQVGMQFIATFTLSESDFHCYLEFARTRNILHENPELAQKEGIRGLMLPGRSIIARAEGEMTRLPEFSDCVMLLYGMDGDPEWAGRNTRFLAEAYAGQELVSKFTVTGGKEEMGYGLLWVDFEITRKSDGKLVAVSKRNIYRIKIP